MAKKLKITKVKGNSKERKRLQKENKNKQINEANEKLRKDQEEQTKELERQEQERKQKLIEKIESDKPSSTKTLKSKSKANGVKSTFVKNANTLLITSFGNGNSANREKYVNGSEITDIKDSAAFTLSIGSKENDAEKKFIVSGRMEQDARPDNPLLSTKKAGQDLIHLREDFEKIFFGKTFDDNIHIQVAYKILDISKILSSFANNIVYELNNMLRSDKRENHDIVGSLGFEKSYNTFIKSKPFVLFEKLLFQPQLGYFGDTLLFLDKNGKLIKKEKNEEAWQEYEERCYYLLATLGMVRQATAHGDFKQRSMIYCLEDNLTGNDDTSICIRKAGAELDRIYSERITKLNADFLTNAGKKDLSLLFRALRAKTTKEKQQIAQDYYKFIVLKRYKNLGFSIKRLREVIIGQEADYLADDEYNTCRNKLNHLLDFLISRYYTVPENSMHLNELVDKLRASMKDSEKTLIYMDEAKKIWPELEPLVRDDILPKLTKDGILSIAEMQEMDSSVLDSVAIPNKAYRFTEMIYLMTLFLDGKEINDLTTQLINCFDNISSFLEVMKEENIECEFVEQYKLLHNSAKIVEELRILNSFARMSKEDPNVKVEMFVEAAEVLGYLDNKENTEEKLREYAQDVFDHEKGLKKSNNKKDNGFRNFIINNVINSSRFKYLVRYGNPKRVRALVSNKKVVDFVLKNIPDDQIKAYYESCNDKAGSDLAQMREDLAQKIQGFNFSELNSLATESSESDKWQEDKERKKKLVRLYLTVLYLLQKSLVLVNSRYYIAFHCEERDSTIYYAANPKADDKEPQRGDYAIEFVKKQEEKAKKEGKKPKRSVVYLSTNIDNSNKKSWTYFRNCVEHLNVVRDAYCYIGDIEKFDSYFELYHYLVQRYIMEKFDNNPKGFEEGKLSIYYNKVKKYNSFCKDFVKTLTIPFAYNLPRYKNLSINELFDRNHYLEDRKKMYKELENDN